MFIHSAIRIGAVGLAMALLPAQVSGRNDEAEFAQMRQEMVSDLKRYTRRVGDESGSPTLSDEVWASMEKVPRHRFVPDDEKDYAYENRPLPIGYGQTISQPYIVALMTDLAQADKDDIVLEIGTGSGYQAAVFSEIAAHVYTMEIVEPLAEAAARRFEDLGYTNITTRTGDGYYGWPEHAPYDIILVTAAATGIPPPLITQLKPGGRMVIPVGEVFFTQQLLVLRKDDQGKVTTQHILPVRFVPLTGDHRSRR
jgi:protein-L-isoaspartate(D-aspartate) O-methyltransferase